MVEFAIAASVFAAILLGIIEFGLATVARNAVVTDASEGARYAIVHGSQSGAIATATDVANYVKSVSSFRNSIVVTTTWSPDNTPGSIVTVKVKNPVPRRGPFLPAHTDSATSKMIVIF